MSVVDARAAHARGDWRAAYDALSPDREALEPTDLALLEEAAWWLGATPDSMAVSEDLYQRLVADGSAAQASDRALRLSLQWFARGDVQIAYAWLARAQRLLRTLPRCSLHGYLAYLEAGVDLEVTGDPEPAAAAASVVTAHARDFADPTLDSFALALGGLAEVRRGRTAAGFAQLDEAMLPVLAGRVDPLWSGDLYCTVIHLCDALADLARMRAWTEALARWSTPRSTTFMFAGVTRIHELQLIAAEGDWDVVEHELGDRSADLVGAHGWLAGEGYYALGEVRRLRGDADGARTAYDRSEELGRDPQPGRALLLRDEGRPDDALAQLRVALAEQDRLGRAGMLPAAVDLALESGDRAYAASLVDELAETAARYGTAGLRARTDVAAAALRLVDGAPAAAVPLLEDAAQVYREQRYRYASAVVHERLATAYRALGDHPRAEAEEATAVAIYRRLGAGPDLARLTPRDRPGGLTGREVEVLRLVATGSSNAEVATALTISRKTVSRHLANIFTKIGVSSRTAAAAWAHQHGL